MLDNILTRWLFRLIYRRWLWDSHFKMYARIIKVKGWRTALVDWDGCERKLYPLVFGDLIDDMKQKPIIMDDEDAYKADAQKKLEHVKQALQSMHSDAVKYPQLELHPYHMEHLERCIESI